MKKVQRERARAEKSEVEISVESRFSEPVNSSHSDTSPKLLRKVKMHNETLAQRLRTMYSKGTD